VAATAHVAAYSPPPHSTPGLRKFARPAGAGWPAFGGRSSNQLTNSGASSTAALERRPSADYVLPYPLSLPRLPLAEASRQVPPCHRRTLRAVESQATSIHRGGVRFGQNPTTRVFVLRSRSIRRFTRFTCSYAGITRGSRCLGDGRFSNCAFPVKQPTRIEIESTKDLGMPIGEGEQRHQHC
jgi:hypothetical protein